MNKLSLLPLIIYFISINAMSADAKGNTSSPSKILGAPVNTAISGGSLLPQGMLLTAVNSSFRDKDNQIKGSGSPDIYSQIWLLKIRS